MVTLAVQRTALLARVLKSELLLFLMTSDNPLFFKEDEEEGGFASVS